MVNRSQRHLLELRGYTSGSVSGAPGTILGFTAVGGLGRATYNISPGPGCFQVGVYWVPAGDTLNKSIHQRHGVPTAPLTPMVFVDGDPNLVNILPNGDFSAAAGVPVLDPPFSIGAGVLTKAGAPEYAMTSLDGVTGNYYRTPYNVDNSSYYDLAYSPSLNRLVAVSNSGDLSVQVMTSDDGGITWVARAVPEDQDLNGVAWSASLAKFVAVGSAGANRGLISADGITWTPIVNANLAALSYRGICWSPELSLFVAAAVTGSANAIATSPDGLVWTRRNSAGHGGWAAVCWAGPPMNLFVAVANNLANAFRIATSPDGITWTGRATPFDATFQPRVIGYSPTLNRLVAFGNTNTTVGATSVDGITWVEVPMAEALGYGGVGWGNGQFILTNTSSTGAASVHTSPNGTVWTPQPGVRRQAWRPPLWVPALGKWVIVASGSGSAAADFKAAKWGGYTFKDGEVLRGGVKVTAIVAGHSARLSVVKPDMSVDVTLVNPTAVGDWMFRNPVGPATVQATEVRVSASSLYSFSVDDFVMFRETGQAAPQGVWDLYPFASTIGGLEGVGFAPQLGVRVV